jgi:hypothetical protein
MFGHDVSEFIGKPLDWIIPDYKRYVEQAKLMGKKWPVAEVIGAHKSGQQIQLELSLGRVQEEQQAPLHGHHP